VTPEEQRVLIEEHDADTVAKEKPPVRFADVQAEKLGGTTYEIAAKLGKVVIARAIEAGMSDESVKAMRQRMLKWLGIVKAFEADRFEIQNDEKLDAKQKATMIASMYAEEDKARIGIFGE
jgi:hypothetical protein